MTTTVLPAAPRCATCNAPAVTDGTTVRHAHPTWCPYARSRTPTPPRPTTPCFVCGDITDTRLCATCHTAAYGGTR